MVRDHGRFVEVADLAGVEVLTALPGPYAPALSTPIPPFPAAAARPGPVLVSRRSSRGDHVIPVDGIAVDGLSLRDLHAAVTTASVLIGPNSGAAHFAALFGCRTIVFDCWNHHAMLPEGAGHWFTWSEAGLRSVIAAL